MSWVVKISISAEKELMSLQKSKALSKEDIKVLLQWLDEMSEFGPDFIAASPNWHDHELSRAWKACRSSAFSKGGRIIYRIKAKVIEVEVLRITTLHDYKR